MGGRPRTGGDARKQRLRAELLTARRELSGPALEAARGRVREAVLARCTSWRAVAAYRPLRTEPGSIELIDDLLTRGIRVIVPVTLPDRDLSWVEVPGDLPLGLAAICEVDVVLAPALAAAADGTRLGRGGGSYDRALRRVRPGTEIAALLHDGELFDRLPADEWDVPVTARVTPSGGWRDVR